MTRSALAAPLATLVLACAATVARATEIAPPPPLGTGDAGAVSAMTLLQSWTMESTLGRIRGSERRYPTLDARVSDEIPAALVTVDGGTGRPVLHLPGVLAFGIPVYELPADVSGGRGGAFDLVLELDAAGESADATLAVPTDASLAGGTRFDVRTSAFNPIEISGDVVDDLVALVVKTPEPTTLALFALGGAGLLALVARRKRRRLVASA